MKRIKYSDDRYYPDEEDHKRVKHNGIISLKDLASHLGYSEMHLWRKLTKNDYPNNAFSEGEVRKIEKLCNIKFPIH
jgi:predicted DNA-binding transcriptional regulator AlpA